MGLWSVSRLASGTPSDKPCTPDSPYTWRQLMDGFRCMLNGIVDKPNHAKHQRAP